MSDPLFGPGIALSGPWATHLSAASRVGWRTAARALPGLVGHAMGAAWSADRRALLASGTAQLVRAAAAAAGLLAVNAALAELLAGGMAPERIWPAMPALAVAVAAAAVGTAAHALVTAADGRLAPKVQRVNEERLLVRAARVELAVLEDGSFQRALVGARLGLRSSEQLALGVLAATGTVVTLVALVAVATILHPVLLTLVGLAVVPEAWKAATVARLDHSSTMEFLNQSRQRDLLADVLMERGAPAEEIRVHGLAPLLLGHYRRLADGLEAERTRLAKAHAGRGLLAAAVSGLAKTLVFVVVGWLLVTGAMPPAAAGTALFAIARVTGHLNSLVVRFRGLYAHSLFVADHARTLRDAADAAIPVGGRPAPSRPRRIAVADVTFTYPGRARPAVRGVDLELRRGEVVALVGANGSGKSTLAKLIAGLHLAQGGTIAWDGVDVRDLDRDSLFDRVAWIGQDFQRWPFTARANAALGRPVAFLDSARLQRAAVFSGADEVVSGLPYGWNTLLAREFQGGTNLSGGQWQRLAVARGHFRDAEILICDEPTASLDPVTEVDTFQRLMALAADGRTVVLISHRLSALRSADRIYVMDEGQVSECGTFAALVAGDGLFSRMYRAQQQQYAAAAGASPATPTG